MASKAKKLSGMKIKNICVSGKALREEVVFKRVSGELEETFKVYLDCCASEFESIKCCSSLSGLIKRSSGRFFDLFSEKVKFSRDKYAVLQVRWYEYVREVLGSEEVRKIVDDSGKDGDIVRSIVSCYLESLWNVSLQYVMGVQGNEKAKKAEVRHYPRTSEDKVSLLKLGSAAAISLRKRLRKVLNTMSSRKSTQSVRNILVKQMTAIDVMEDKKKESLPGFIKSLDEGNLFVLKFESIPFLESFSQVFSEVVNQESYNLLGNKLFKVAEQHVKNDNRTRRAFSTVLKELDIELTPSTRCDFYNRFLRKIYNIRCNEFIRAHKCLEEHHCQQTQDRQVMLREKLKVQLQK